MTGLKITYELRTQGWTQTRLAKELDVTPSLVNNVIHDRATCYRVAEYIARLLQSTPQELWPYRYVFKPRETRNRKGEPPDEIA